MHSQEQTYGIMGRNQRLKPKLEEKKEFVDTYSGELPKNNHNVTNVRQMTKEQAELPSSKKKGQVYKMYDSIKKYLFTSKKRRIQEGVTY